jgi:cytochrome c oxidase assembly protein subunit 15
MTDDHRYTFHRPLHALAILVAAATFPLIFMGGLVTTHGAGMAVPDWPNSYGYNMFTFPPSQWVGGIWYEHVHRLWGSLVGFLSILLCLNAWGPGAVKQARPKLAWTACAFAFLAIVALLVSLALPQDVAKQVHHAVIGFASIALILGAARLSRRREPRRWVRWLCTTVLVAVIAQGVMGGLRVTEVNLTLAMIHGCFAHAFFCLAAFAAVATSRWWVTAPDRSGEPVAPFGRRIAAFGAICAALIFAQLVVGATMRHNDAGLAIPDLPLAFGGILPPTDADGLAAANRQRARLAAEESVQDSRIRRHLAAPVTLAQVWLHFAHRAGAVLVSAALLWLIVATGRRREGLTGWIGAVAGLLVLQFTLGVLTVYWRKPADIASLHVATGAVLLMATAVLTIRAMRMYSRLFRARAVAGQPAGGTLHDRGLTAGAWQPAIR